jgi:N-acetylglucosamine-6-sulfatase
MRRQTVLSLDIAPTLLELGGAAVPAGLHGKSLAPLLKDDLPDIRRSFLIERFSDQVFRRVADMGYQAIRSARWKYIRYSELEGMDELYDLAADPYEMQNVIARPENQPALVSLRREMLELLQSTAAAP